MKITLAVDVRGARRKFDLHVNAIRDVNAILRQFDRYKRQEVDGLFSSGGKGDWPARKTKTPEAVFEQRADVIRKRAVGAMRKVYQKDITRAGRRAERAAPEKQERATSALVRRKAALEEFEKAVESGAKLDFDVLSGGDKRFIRARQKPITQYQTADEKARNTLGRIAQSITSRLERGTLTIESRIPWAGIHNEGGVAGQGAEIPKRTFLEWTDDDIEVLQRLCIEHQLAAYD